MTWYLRIYLLALGAVAAVAFIMSVRDIATAALMVTLGLAFPFVFIATLLPYMLCFLPLAAALPNRWRTAIALPTSLVLAAGWFALPNMLSVQKADEMAFAASASDTAPAGPLGARSIELRRPKSLSYDIGGQSLPEEPCPDFCRSMLVNGEIDWLRVVMVKADGSPDQSSAGASMATLYRAGVGQECAVPGEPVETSARCVIFADDLVAPAALTIAVTENSRRRQVSGVGLASVIRTGERLTTFSSRQNDSVAEVLRHTELKFDVITKGSLLGPRFSGINSEGMELLRHGKRYGAADFTSLLRAAGYQVADLPEAETDKSRGDWRNPPTPDQSRAVMSLLDLPGEVPFNDEQGNVIDRWVMNARMYKEWPVERIEFLRRIVRDDRVTRTGFLDQVLERNPKVLVALMPDLLDRADALDLDYGLDPALQALVAMRRVDPSIIKPYAPRIIEIIQKGDGKNGLALALVGRIGVDPVPYLAPLRDPANGQVDGKRITAACVAEAQWSSGIVPLLRALAIEEETARQRGDRENIYRALMRHGDVDFVQQIVARGDPKDAERLMRRLMGDWKRYGASDRFC